MNVMVGQREATLPLGRWGRGGMRVAWTKKLSQWGLVWERKDFQLLKVRSESLTWKQEGEIVKKGALEHLVITPGDVVGIFSPLSAVLGYALRHPIVLTGC